MKPRQQLGFLAPSQQPPAVPVNKFDAVFIIHYMIWCTFWLSLHVHQIYGDSCKDLWILLTKYKQYYTVSGKSTCPFLGWGTPRPCDLLGCMIAIFPQSTRTPYQATHLPSPGMRNPENGTICDSVKTAHQVFQLSRGNLGDNILQIWWKLDVNIAKGFYLEPLHLDQLFQSIDNIEEAGRVTPVGEA